jgi:hypothetical protein
MNKTDFQRLAGLKRNLHEAEGLRVGGFKPTGIVYVVLSADREDEWRAGVFKSGMKAQAFAEMLSKDLEAQRELTGRSDQNYLLRFVVEDVPSYG